MMPNSFWNILQICDSQFPIGSYAHSYGLETYVQRNLVNDVETTRIFIENTLLYNTLYNDAAFVKLAYEATEKNDFDSIISLDDLITATKSASESRKASQKLGVRFMKMGIEFELENSFFKAYFNTIQEKKVMGHYAIAFGMTSQILGVNIETVLTAFYYNTVAAIVNNCAKLVPISQMSGQKIVYQCNNLVNDLVQRTIKLPIEDVGRCAIDFEIKAMQHEDLYSRLYMS
jgi:urease accessory protein